MGTHDQGLYIANIDVATCYGERCNKKQSCGQFLLWNAWYMLFGKSDIHKSEFFWMSPSSLA
jgi:hypothetical protein